MTSGFRPGDPTETVAITRRVHEYAYGIDGRDWDLYRSIFADEITTDFTIGDAVEQAAKDLRDFWQSQVPCSEVSVSGATVTVDYGTLDDNCTWRGKTYAGIHEFTVDVAQESRLTLRRAQRHVQICWLVTGPRSDEPGIR